MRRDIIRLALPDALHEWVDLDEFVEILGLAPLVWRRITRALPPAKKPDEQKPDEQG